MSQPAATLGDEPLTHILNGLRGAIVGLAIGLLAIGVLFHTEMIVAVHTWIDSTAYNHCFLIIPIVIFLIWDRRSTLAGLAAEPLPLAALLAIPLGIAWLAAERLGIMEGRQLVAVSMVEVLFLAMLGRRLWLALLGPLLYLYFLVPFGEFLTPKLQDITTWFIRHGLDILGIPAYIDGYIIDIPEGSFFVAEACAGLRFLIASIAFGVLYAERGEWDAGVGDYTAKTFSPQRYEIWTMQSGYHNLPTIDGVMQHDGRHFAASQVRYHADDAAAEIELNIEKAYPEEANLEFWRRRVRFDRAANRVELFERYSLKKPVKKITLTLMTPCEVQRDAAGQLTLGPVRVFYDASVFSPVTEEIKIVDNERLHDSWGDRLFRVLLVAENPIARGEWRLQITQR